MNIGDDELSHEELLAAVEDGSVAVIDVREPHEFAAGHVPGALNLPLSRFRAEDLPTGKPVALICQAGVRSAKALREARAAGFTEARHYRGGTAGWRALGGKIEI